MNYYPAFLSLEGKKAVVIGGGKVAERKILALIDTGADIIVVSPLLTRRLLKEKEKKSIRHISRNYRKKDLINSFLVIAATDSPTVNSKVAREAPALVNVVDVPAECNFIVPSVVKRAPLTIAISTGGASPAFAKTVREELERLYDSGFSEYLKFIGRIRSRAMTEIKDKKEREKLLKKIASKEILDILRSKGLSEARKKASQSLVKLLKS